MTTAQPTNIVKPETALTAADVDLSCRLPLLVLFISAAVWLLAGSVFALIASIKFHSPEFLAGPAWLTYGRVYPAYLNAVLYGFCIQAGLGVSFWLLARLGRTLLVQRWLITVGAIFWNLGVTIGVIGILAGDATGFEMLDMPGYSTVCLFLGYLMMSWWGALTFHRRERQPLFVSQWFIFAALFWFPWIYSTAELLLLARPVRGVVQAVIAWWYAANLQVVWLWLIGLSGFFYFLARFAGRELHSRYLALFAFWIIVLFGSWSGIPNSAPLPAWLPTLSTIGTVLLAIPLVCVATSYYRTRGGGLARSTDPLMSFVTLAVASFLLAGLMRVFGALLVVSQVVGLTWYGAAMNQLNFYGFFAVMMFGAIYYIVPRLMGVGFPWPALVRTHFWLALFGIGLVAVPLAVAGVVEGATLQNPNNAFVAIMKTSLNFLRVSTVGYLLILVGHGLLLGNLVALLVKFYRAEALSTYTSMTTVLKPAEVKA